jgi:hypothetical protein
MGIINRWGEGGAGEHGEMREMREREVKSRASI